METINILLLEDDSGEIMNFKSTAERLKHEGLSDFIIKDFPSFLDKKGEIFTYIIEQNVDFIIVDLKLANGDDEGGNQFLNSIKDIFYIPIIINSANLGDLEGLYNQSNNPLLKQFNPSSSNTDEIFDHIISIYNTGITKVIGKKGIITKTLNDLIWKGGLSNIQEWEKYSDKSKSTTSLGRYILAHLYNDLGESSKDFHPEECYIKNSNGKRFTGTILKKDTFYYIILNPACDLAQGNMNYFIIANVRAFIDEEIQYISKIKTQYSSLTDDKNETEKKKIIETINKNIKSLKKDHAKYLKFIPESTIFPGGFINFREIKILPFDQIEEYDIVCNISVDFLKDIIPDFGNYFSRQGQPDLDYSIL